MQWPTDAPATGYLNPDYVKALSEFGQPIELTSSRGWALRRAIDGGPECDAIGGYPFLACQDWTGLAADLEQLRGDLVSFACTPDPFGNYALSDLESLFPDCMHHFKDHFIADLSLPPERIISRHHRKYAERAFKKVEVEFSTVPYGYLEEWLTIFGTAVRQFGVTGIRAYSRAAFSRHLALPGAIMSLARHRGKLVAAHVQMLHGETAYAHLASQTEDAYHLGAAYALYHAEIHYYAGKVRWIDWGGGVGVSVHDRGLSAFKRGWSTGTRPAYFCGRIFDRDRYRELARAREIALGAGTSLAPYFPAYREGEFA